MMYPSHSYESQLPGQQATMNMGSFGVAPVGGSFGQPANMQQPLTDMRAGSMGRQDYAYPYPQGQGTYSSQTYAGPGPGGTKAPECEEECAEEECDPDQCGDEQRAPTHSTSCGID